ncbi:uncharacterized protein LOC105431017 isoform X2 [Pogonomyrmex barbatus]|uniref:Uncharacterized protein LOC105431017 isoform X2 n=1 Tax=Pogonomyrmex barbatus TaxID=144034 RepID=A0A6I9XDS9_9HYME|nr:uncharacterized protein LOC105431017 isoform X2 [Pogonomyrmex barbatus]
MVKSNFAQIRDIYLLRGIKRLGGKLRSEVSPEVTRNMEIIALLVLLVAELALGDMINSVFSRMDPCTSLCEKTPIGFPNSTYVKSCCQRGCRFFNLVDLRYGWEQNNLNGTRSACEASCIEAYADPNDRYACSTGCNFMAKQRISDLLSLFSIAICMEEGIDSNVLPMSLDMPENDILTDPGLRKELLPRWWDSDGFKLPQTYVKTIPTDARSMDYTLSSDYSGETKHSASTSKYESFQREMERVKSEDIFTLSTLFDTRFYVVFILVIMIATAVYLVYIDSVLYIFMDILDMPHRDYDSPSDLSLFIPDEAVMYKIPPPKYDESSCRSNV